MQRSFVLCTILLISIASSAAAQTRPHAAKPVWKSATASQLEGALPLRAVVEKERIETEMMSATGIIDGHGRVIAAVVLITAGYAAQGKYSHYLLTTAPVAIGTDIRLGPGAYVMGWVRSPDGLMVHIYEAETGKERGIILARPLNQTLPVVPIKIWPPAERSVIQIGRFMLPYMPVD